MTGQKSLVWWHPRDQFSVLALKGENRHKDSEPDHIGHCGHNCSQTTTKNARMNFKFLFHTSCSLGE